MNLYYRGFQLDLFSIALLRKKKMYVIVRVNKNVHSQPFLVSLCKKGDLNLAGGSLRTFDYA